MSKPTVATGPGWELRLGRWQAVLTDVTAKRPVDVLITDPPYSERTHASKPTRADGVDDAGLSPDYEPWTRDDVWTFVHEWHPFVHGWMVCLTDCALIEAYREAYEEVGRCSFAAVACVINGMTCRMQGDGPSSEAIYAMVARPRNKEFVAWGTLRGVYSGPAVRGSSKGRGKPPWLMQAIVRDYSRPGNLVADPMAGWGATLEACVALNRRGIGAEMNPAAFDEAVRRLRRPLQVDLLAGLGGAA